MTAEQFWAKLDKSGGPDSCWPFPGAHTRGGYGNIYYRGRYWRGNRLALFLSTGHISAHALHTCDNPPCCNPRHIYDGDEKRNRRDSIERGRFRSGVTRGEQSGMAKLTEVQVRAIRAADATCVTLAAQYGISKSNVWCIRARQTWQHI